jgi:hypothetical protein
MVIGAAVVFVSVPTTTTAHLMGVERGPSHVPVLRGF